MVSHLSHNFLGFSNSEKNDFLCENPKDSNVNKVIRQSYVKAEFPDENNRTKDGPLTAIKDCKSKVQTGHLEHQDVDVTAPRKHVINKHARYKINFWLNHSKKGKRVTKKFPR